MSDKQLILVVDDDPDLVESIAMKVESHNFRVAKAYDGVEAWEKIKEEQPELIILDVMMPRKDGFSMAAEIRNTDEKTPIIFLTAKSLKEDRVKGFQMGCDDYMTKPFSTEELSLRIKAILRRCVSRPVLPDDKDEIKFDIGKFTFDPVNMILGNGSKQQTLTRKESALLKLLCVYKNKLLSRETALKSIWGNDDYFIGRSMDVFISKLRKHKQQKA